MSDSFDIVYNKELDCWEERKEPYTTIEIATEKDYELLMEKIKFYDQHQDKIENYKEEIEHLKARLEEYKKPIDKFIKDREAQAVKEFAELIKKNPRINNYGLEFVALVDIDAELKSLLKEYEK